MLVLFEDGFHGTISSALGSTVSPYVTWEFDPNPVPPPIANRSQKRTITSNLALWTVINRCVTSNGPMTPVRLFIQDQQVDY